MTPSVEDIEAWLGRRLPEPYRSFLSTTTHHFLAGDRTLVYGRDNVVERNQTYQSQEYCPGYLMVGDDSGGSAVLLSLTGGTVHRVGMGVMTKEWFEPVAASFTDWVSQGFSLPDE